MSQLPPRRWVQPALLAMVAVIATSGLVYELVTGTLASYVLGDSVTQFSLVIGLYLFAMGIGSYLSKFLEDRLLQRFVEIELCLALAGGLSAPLLFKVYTAAAAFRFSLYGVVLLTARAIGEFGAVSVVSGHIRGQTNTVPLHVEILYNEYRFQAAFAVASLLALLALVTLALKSMIDKKGHQA